MKTIRHTISLLLVLSLLFAFSASCARTGQTSGTSEPPTTVNREELFPTVDDSLILERQTKILFRLDKQTVPEKLITKTVDFNTFVSAYCTYYSCAIWTTPPSIAKIDEDFGIECMRKNEAGNYYSVHKSAEGGLLYVFYKMGDQFPESYLEMYSWFAVQKKLSYKDFSAIKRGSDIEAVKAIDPVAAVYGEHALNYIKNRDEDATGMKFYSQHYLTDGILNILYSYRDGKYVVYYMYLNEDFQVDLLEKSDSEPYDGNVLKIDRLPKG